MVVQAGFSVCLMDAESNKALKEFSKDGKHYVEAEPGTEYFIHVKRDGTGDASVVRCSFEVDGVDLDYYLNDDLQEGHDIGAWECKSGVSTTKSLRFEKPRVSTNGGVDDRTGVMMGVVKVDFFQAIPIGQQKLAKFRSKDPACKIGLSSELEGNDKAVRSKRGTMSQSENVSATTMMYKTGEKLTTISIQYCTTLGLVLAGVLPKPPYWEKARLLEAASRKSEGRKRLDPNLSGIVAKKIKRPAFVRNGIELSKAVELELFDLSHLHSDSDSEDEY